MAIIKYQVKENNNLGTHSFYGVAQAYSTLDFDDLADDVVEDLGISPSLVKTVLDRYHAGGEAKRAARPPREVRRPADDLSTAELLGEGRARCWRPPPLICVKDTFLFRLFEQNTKNTPIFAASNQGFGLSAPAIKKGRQNDDCRPFGFG